VRRLGLAILLAAAACVQPPRPMPLAPDLKTLDAPTDSSWAGLKVVEPTIKVRPETIYPDEAKKRHLQGWVALQYVIDTAGKVDPNGVVVLKASDPVFIPAAKEMIQEQVLEPARVDSTPVRAAARQLFTFAMSEGKSDKSWVLITGAVVVMTIIDMEQMMK
jgi:outer membrane biosynthesis protein TonB